MDAQFWATLAIAFFSMVTAASTSFRAFYARKEYKLRIVELEKDKKSDSPF